MCSDAHNITLRFKFIKCLSRDVRMLKKKKVKKVKGFRSNTWVEIREITTNTGEIYGNKIYLHYCMDWSNSHQNTVKTHLYTEQTDINKTHTCIGNNIT